MIAFIVGLGPFAWLLLGLLLLALEMVIPGSVLVWFGVAALAIGALDFFVDWPWQAYITAFVVVSAITLVFGRRLTRGLGGGGDRGLNNPAARYLGRSVTLTEPIVNGEGRIQIGDTMWRARGPDLDAGTRVSVTGADGSVLLVAPAVASAEDAAG